MKLFTKTLVLLVAVMLFSMAGFAATFATNVSPGNGVSPTLLVKVNVQNALQLTLSNGASGTHCNISNGSPQDYQIDFQNVNGLGVGTPNCGTVSATTTDATYVTDYQLTPSFSGFSTNSASIKISATAFNNPGTLTLKEGDTAGTVAAVPVTPAALINSPSITNGTPITRYLGVTVNRVNGASAFTGADTSIVTFTLTVP